MRLPATLVATALATACGLHPDVDPSEVEDGFVVPEGKEDNFLSTSAREYVLSGKSTVTVEAGQGLARAKELIALKHVAIAWFLNQYLVEKDHDAANASYGGFTAMVKAGSYEDLAITQKDAVTWEFKFSQVIAGPEGLDDDLSDAGDGRFTVEIGRPTNEEMARLEINHEWYRSYPWDSWDPSKVSAEQKEKLALTIRPEVAPVDAWWDYQRLFDDDKLTIDVHFGWDYHSSYHLTHSRSFYDWLVGKGFKSPVSSYDKYKRTSGPLVKTLKADGRTITVQVRLYWGKPGNDTDPDTDAGGRQLEADMRASLNSRDVIVFSGHSGPFYGFALANWRKTVEGDVDDSELETLAMPPGKYQIVFAEGCDTYMIGEAFKKNPNKQGKDVDVITTTSFSNASSTAGLTDFFTRLLEVDDRGRHRPRTMTALLRDLDGNSAWFDTMYGIHGIDDNPRVHPYANPERLCQSCGSNADCGGTGNSCIKVGQAGKRCAVACTDDSGCPDGYACKKVASASTSTIYGSMCVPATLRCE